METIENFTSVGRTVDQIGRAFNGSSNLDGQLTHHALLVICAQSIASNLENMTCSERRLALPYVRGLENHLLKDNECNLPGIRDERLAQRVNASVANTRREGIEHVQNVHRAWFQEFQDSISISLTSS